MANSAANKFRIKPGFTLLSINAPSNFKKGLGALASGVKIITTGKYYNQVHWFVKDRSQMEKEMDRVIKLVKGDNICWVYYPKKTSKIQTDLTRDKGWDKLLKNKELQWITLISFDETWSMFGFRLKTEADKKKEAAPKVREIFDWVNPQTKEVKLPPDFDAALKKNKKQLDYFNTLSFTNMKEYIEWIVTAKREETRSERIKGTMEKLGKQWKNPRNI